MTRRFQFSFGWGLVGAGFGAALGMGFCFFTHVEGWSWAVASLVLAILFGALGSFFGEKTIELIFEVLSYLVP